MPRPELVNFLRRRLPGGEARIHKGKQVTDIEVHDTGVIVHCADGSSHAGSIVLGADGIHSTVRRVMKTTSVKTDKQQQQQQQKTEDSNNNNDNNDSNNNKNNNIKSTYAALFGAINPNPSSDKPPQPSLPPHVFYEMHGQDAMLQAMHCKSIIYFTIYGRLPEGPTPLSPTRFTESEKQAFAARWADYHCAPGIKVSDMVAQADWTQMVHLEEGVIEKWYGERVVLVGDSVHKMTPNLGLGYNMAVQSAVALVNRLRKVLEESKAPSAAVLNDKVFAPYQAARKKNATGSMDLSGMGLRFASWDGWLAKVVDRHVMPRINGDVLLLKLKAAGLILEGITLDFAEEKGFRDGTKKWKHGRPVKKKVTEKS